MNRPSPQPSSRPGPNYGGPTPLSYSGLLAGKEEGCPPALPIAAGKGGGNFSTATWEGGVPGGPTFLGVGLLNSYLLIHRSPPSPLGPTRPGGGGIIALSLKWLFIVRWLVARVVFHRAAGKRVAPPPDLSIVPVALSLPGESEGGVAPFRSSGSGG